MAQRLPVIESFLPRTFGSTAGTTVISSRSAGRFDSWGTDRFSLRLTCSEFGTRYGEEADVLVTGLILMVHTYWTGFEVAPLPLLTRLPRTS